MDSAAARLTARGEDRCAISGGLTLASAPGLWKQLQTEGWFGRASHVELADVTESDSAGLALLIAWRAARRASGGDLHFEAVPERLIALARLTEAQSLLEG